jgi:hypothetical protein
LLNSYASKESDESKELRKSIVLTKDIYDNIPRMLEPTGLMSRQIQTFIPQNLIEVKFKNLADMLKIPNIL